MGASRSVPKVTGIRIFCQPSIEGEGGSAVGAAVVFAGQMVGEVGRPISEGCNRRSNAVAVLNFEDVRVEQPLHCVSHSILRQGVAASSKHPDEFGKHQDGVRSAKISDLT